MFLGKRGRVYSRGQFTIFIILGLVIFFAFAFAFVSRVALLNSQLTGQADVQIKAYIDQNSINEYVTSCLDSVSRHVLMSAALQGGALNFTGKTEGVDYIVYNDTETNMTYNISVDIAANTACPDPSMQFMVYKNPPDYPYPKTSVLTLKGIYDDTRRNRCATTVYKGWDYRTFSGFFGENRLPILCDYFGVNKIDSDYSANNVRSCDYYSLDSSQSLQEQLQEEVAREMKSCVNFTVILDRSQSNITYIGDSNATILFADNNYYATLTYPFTVMLYNHQPVTRMVNFSVQEDIPFKSIYEYAYELANYNVKDPTFDIVANSSIVISAGRRRTGQNIYNPKFFVSIERGNSSNNYTDLLTINDTMLKDGFGGYPLTIHFAILNREPALDYIYEDHGQGSDYDIAGIENQTLQINPQGYDPDIEPLIYTYSGWKEDMDEYYNYSSLKCLHPTSIADIAGCMVVNNSITSTNAPKNWTNSTIFKATHQNASYVPQHLDTGLHTLRVTVIDRGGLLDYQDIKILIFDTPQAVLNLTKPYSDISGNYSSYEDPYVLNGSASRVGSIAEAMNIQFTTFAWNDSSEPFYKLVSIHTLPDMMLRLPDDINTTTPNITNIKSLVFANRSVKSSVHNITLTVTTQMGLIDSDTVRLNVTQCLPHRNTTNPYSYPYNINPYSFTDALQANHTCCLADYTYAPITTQCYLNVTYGAWNSSLDFTIRDPSPPHTTPSMIYEYLSGVVMLSSDIPSTYPANIYANDIYMQNFTRSCSGYRGNTCTGNAIEIRQIVTSCIDNNSNSDSRFYAERCSGPDPNYYSSNSAVVYNPGCVNYSSGNTFERAFHLGGTGSCTGSNKYYSESGSWNDVGNFSCAGTCNNGACVPDTTSLSCVCNSNSGVNTADSRCNGVQYPGNNYSDNRIKTCTVSNIFADVCNNCGVVASSDNICRGPSFGMGCSANELCDNLPNGSRLPGHCSEGNTGIPDMCDSSCQVVTDASAKCGDGGCSAAFDCIGKLPFDSIPSNEGYCNDSCNVTLCTAGYLYDSTTKTCSTTCNQFISCAKGYVCSNTKCIEM